MASKSGLSSLALNPEGAGEGKHPLWTAMGGSLGIIETVVPGLIFVVVLAITRDPWLAIGISVAISVLFTAYRLIRRQAATQALVGLAGVVLSAALALLTNRPEDNFVPGLITNAAYSVVFLVSILATWPIIGVAVGLIRGEGFAWRKNKHHLRVYSGVTAIWFGMFALRLIVQYPLYLSGNVEGLATAKLLLGLPLYVPVLALTWLIVRSLYREKTSSS